MLKFDATRRVFRRIATRDALWFLAIPILFSIPRAVAIAFIAVINALWGVQMSLHPPPTERKSFYIAGFVTSGLLLVSLTILQDREQSSAQQKVESYVAGGKYPEIVVQLYDGPNDGMKKSFTLSPPNPGVTVVQLQNTNAFPIYDLSIDLYNPIKTSGQYFKYSTNFLNPKSIFSTFLSIPLTNWNHFYFRVSTRAGITDHRFTYAIIGNQWEYSNTVVDLMSQKTVAKEVSPGWGKKGR
jgi:hypothetical protein